MKVKQMALFFIFLLSSQYSLGVGANVKSVFGNLGCNVKPPVAKRLNQAFDNIRKNLPNSFQFTNITLEQNLQANGSATGFKNFRAGTYACECAFNYVRIKVDISFLQVLFDFTMYILDDQLGGHLGPVGIALVTLLDGLVRLPLKLFGLNILVQMTVAQEYFQGKTVYIENFQIYDGSDITLLGLNLSLVSDLLSPILTPILNLLLEITLEGPVKKEFEKELNKIAFERDDITCK